MELKLTKETAKKLYPVVPEWFQELLSETFGKDCFERKSYNEIKTFENACEEIGLNPVDFNRNGVGLPDEIGYMKLKVVIMAINQGWTPDWKNTNQKKWYPWFKLSSGFGLSHSDYGYVSADTAVGSRLCFETKEKSDYAATQFLGLYKEFLT